MRATTTGFAILLAALTACAGLSPKPRAPRKSVVMGFRQLCSDKTTESGADEIFVTTFSQRGNEKWIGSRAPGNAQHWDMNDGDQPTNNPNGDSHCITDRVLFQGELADGESYQLNVSVMEEDGGTTKTAQEVASQIAVNLPDPRVQAAGTVLAFVTKFGVRLEDTDDVIGSVNLRITNTAGAINVQWGNTERVSGNQADPSFGGESSRRELRMNGDGSNYVTWFFVR